MAVAKKIPVDLFTQSTWLITFADLITLVMCAFIMFFSLSQSSATKIGTQVAQDSQGASPIWVGQELLFTQNDVRKQGGELTAESIKVVKNLIESGDYKFQAVRISVCSGVFAEGFASNLVKVLSETGVPAAQVSVRFFGTSCGELNNNRLSPKDELVGKLALTIEEENIKDGRR